MKKSSVKNAVTAEKSAKILFLVCAVFSVVAVFTIVVYLLAVSVPVFRKVGIVNFLFKRVWAANQYLDGDRTAATSFGILPMIVSSLVVTSGAVVLGGTLGVCAAVFATYYCPKRLKGAYQQTVNLLAGIPSVVYGFFGLVVIVPLLERLFGVDVGKGTLAAILVLSLMIMPTVASVAKNSMEAVPKEYFEGALALGNTRSQAIFKVCVPAAKKGVVSALILGVGRAVGETMAVQMVVGNSINWFPIGPFQGVRTLTTHIVMEMAYSTGLWKDGLVATGFVLLVFVLLVNLVLNLVKREKTVGERRKRFETKSSSTQEHVFKRGGKREEVLKYVCTVLAVFVVFVLGAMIVFVAVKGIPNLTKNFLFGKATNANATLLPALVSTLMIVAVTLLIALPLGICAAIYLNEYSKKGGRLVKIIRLFIDTLSGIPSIVFGLFGMVFFVGLLGKRCVLAGALTMVLVVLPTVVRSTEESLREVPNSMREGSLALGASKVRTIFKIVLPSALGGIVTSIILSVGRIVGESAALIYTAGAVFPMPQGLSSQGSSFAVLMYTLTTAGKTDVYGQTSIGKAYATAFILLVVVAALNLLVTLLENRIKKKTLGKEAVKRK